ncbi:MAG: cobalamin B12-binding domain-containing protein, partial [Candidatus Omnitrophica bacterium]|nr:cobalamin B12-binding domain-containing protein [Candidatus Omnitrophota bacterium]
MKTLLVNPSSKYINSHKLYRQFLPPIAPLGLAYIAAVLEANKFDVDIIDMYADRISGSELLKIIKDRKPQLIGFSVLTSVIDDVRCLVSGIRSVDKETKIVLGNTHASFFADSLLKEGLADIIVRGEGEYSMLDICKSLDN